jgi:hypothetical protein
MRNPPSARALLPRHLLARRIPLTTIGGQIEDRRPAGESGATSERLRLCARRSPDSSALRSDVSREGLPIVGRLSVGTRQPDERHIWIRILVPRSHGTPDCDRNSSCSVQGTRPHCAAHARMEQRCSNRLHQLRGPTSGRARSAARRRPDQDAAGSGRDRVLVRPWWQRRQRLRPHRQPARPQPTTSRVDGLVVPIARPVRQPGPRCRRQRDHRPGQSQRRRHPSPSIRGARAAGQGGRKRRLRPGQAGPARSSRRHREGAAVRCRRTLARSAKTTAPPCAPARSARTTVATGQSGTRSAPMPAPPRSARRPNGSRIGEWHFGRDGVPVAGPEPKPADSTALPKPGGGSRSAELLADARPASADVQAAEPVSGLMTRVVVQRTNRTARRLIASGGVVPRA